MQDLQPFVQDIQLFKRPSLEAMRETRDFLDANIKDIAALYRAARDHDSCQPMGVRVGDLHEWSSLRDGCLYIDQAATDDRPYYYQRSSGGDWVSIDGVADNYESSVARGHKSDYAQVIAVLAVDATREDFCVAVVRYHDATNEVRL